MATSAASTNPETSAAPSDKPSGIKAKLHQIGEKLALVPATPAELEGRLDKAEREGDDEKVHRLHMKIAASGQNASTSQEDVAP